MFEIYELDTVNLPTGKTIARIVGRGIGGRRGTGETFLGVFGNETDAENAYDRWADELEGSTAMRPWEGIDQVKTSNELIQFLFDHPDAGERLEDRDFLTANSDGFWAYDGHNEASFLSDQELDEFADAWDCDADDIIEDRQTPTYWITPSEIAEVTI